MAFMLTTKDNPFNPETQFDEWFAFDTAKGYNSCGLLDRYVVTSDELSEEQQEQDIDFAIDRIVLTDPTGLYKKHAIVGGQNSSIPPS